MLEGFRGDLDKELTPSRRDAADGGPSRRRSLATVPLRRWTPRRPSPREADRSAVTLLKVWQSRYPDPATDLDSAKGMGESCGHVDDREAPHSATPGVYCDDCAHLDGWDCDCERCAEGREMSA